MSKWYQISEVRQEEAINSELPSMLRVIKLTPWKQWINETSMLMLSYNFLFSLEINAKRLN